MEGGWNACFDNRGPTEKTFLIFQWPFRYHQRFSLAYLYCLKDTSPYNRVITASTPLVNRCVGLQQTCPCKHVYPTPCMGGEYLSRDHVRQKRMSHSWVKLDRFDK